jgi:DNA polymerase III epsilon subunit family exonuclease
VTCNRGFNRFANTRDLGTPNRGHNNAITNAVPLQYARGPARPAGGAPSPARTVGAALYRKGMTGSREARARPLIGADLVVVDVETTGLVPARATIIEIGAVRLSGAQVTGEFFSLVNPEIPVPPDITALTGITDEMVTRAPSAGAALRAFLAFARGAVLVAHNAPFDLAFLTSGCAAAGLAWPAAAVLDTAVLARLLLGSDQVPDCRLATLAGYFAVTATPCHRALADAQATGEVLLGLLARAAAARPGMPAAAPAPAAPAPAAPAPAVAGDRTVAAAVPAPPPGPAEPGTREPVPATA